MVAARRKRQRRAAEGEHFHDVVARGDNADGLKGKLRRQADPRRAQFAMQRQRRLVVDIEERTDHMVAAVEKLDGRDVVGLDQIARFDHLLDGADFALSGRQRQGRIDHFLAAMLQPVDDVENDFVAERLALRTHDRAEANPIDRRLVGDAGVEIDPAVDRPVEQYRPQSEFQAGGRFAHRHAFL